MFYQILLISALLLVFLGLPACNTSLQQSLLTEQAGELPFYIEQNWVDIPEGSFLMGSEGNDKEFFTNEKPQHIVYVNKPFKISRYEVTFGEYERFAKATNRRIPKDADFSEGQHQQLPVISVSWVDASAYAQWLSEVSGKHFRLPTEAEWEYAARANTNTKRFWGDDEANSCDYANVFDKANEAKIRQHFSVPVFIAANHSCHDPYLGIAPVGSFKPNPWGLYDMLGNVWEWVQDCQHKDYGGAPILISEAWETANEGDCSKRGVRGGSWFVSPNYVRVANRSWNHPDDLGTGIGFRLVQD